MKLIVAVDKNWAIGNKGKLLAHIPQDQKRFRDMTLGKVVVMGRSTLESLPGAQPLYGRTNIVLSKNPAYTVKRAVVCHSIEETLRVLEPYPGEDIYIIGGESIYQQFLPFCDEAEVTWIDFSYEADTWFPNLARLSGWELTAESDEQTCFDLCYTYQTYKKIRERQKQEDRDV